MFYTKGVLIMFHTKLYFLLFYLFFLVLLISTINSISLNNTIYITPIVVSLLINKNSRNRVLFPNLILIRIHVYPILDIDSIFAKQNVKVVLQS